jgi:quercetin dioxygenase-like cupin family protein
MTGLRVAEDAAMSTTNEGVWTVRRVVTGHDDTGRAVILSDAPPPRVHQVGGPGGPTFIEVWNTRETPTVIDRSSGEPSEPGLVLAPPAGGTRIRVIEFPPEGEAIRTLTREQVVEKFGEMAGAGAVAGGAGAPHPLMHRTETVDYGIVLEGELTLVVDRGETTVRAGDMVIQRGTNHAWANRASRPCRVAFVLIDGRFADGLQS